VVRIVVICPALYQDVPWLDVAVHQPAAMGGAGCHQDPGQDLAVIQPPAPRMRVTARNPRQQRFDPGP
jgi:hypothetical protein